MNKIKKYLLDNKMFVMFLGSFILLFTLVAILMTLGKMSYIDSIVHAYILKIRTDNLNSFFNVFTELGGASFLLGLCVILFITMKNKKRALYIFINLVLAFIVNETVKSMFMRTRPIGINLIQETGYSFPSGHSMVSLTFYGLLTYMILKNIKNKVLKVIINMVFLLLVFTIGFSRIYLGVHYLSDVIAGFLLSCIYLTIFIKFINLEKK